ncbi:hypothetical protein ACFLYO_04365 [Chloroflexota bacterium]
MNWQDLRAMHPHNWVLVEALNATTKSDRRIVKDMALIAVCGGDWQIAWDKYKDLHKKNREREYYVLHTDREILDIGILDTFGRMAS